MLSNLVLAFVFAFATACAGSFPASASAPAAEPLLFSAATLDSAPEAKRSDFPAADYSPAAPRVDSVFPASAAADSDTIVTLSGADLSPVSTIIFTHLASGRIGILPASATDSDGNPLRDSADAPAILEFFVSPALYLPPGVYEIVVKNPEAQESAPVRFTVEATK